MGFKRPEVQILSPRPFRVVITDLVITTRFLFLYAKNKDLYYDSLSTSQDGWHEGHDNPVPFIKYLLGTILSAYRDFEDWFALVETKRTAFETVRLATENKIGRFTKQDIRELCPSISVSSIEGALRKLVESGELKRENNGKNTCYYRTK